ncbi:TonB-dependent receptor [Brevundimonas balnearis]|uniref:TonB-dependent receptor n=1 Tax=Brevundimonas balnearis TaxID=1572858 RepID=A0ABV6R2G3_9CAUL
MRHVVSTAALVLAAGLAGAAAAQERRVVTVEEVVITAAPYGVTADATTIAVDVLDEEDLLTAPSAGLGDVLNGLPGVRSTSFAAGASRPVIRGLAGPRVQVLTNGVGLIDASALSPDHQVAADPGEATRIEVLRGPQTLAFGGSAIGGVVNVIDGRIPEEIPEGGIDGRVSAQSSSVDDGYKIGGGVSFAAGPLVFTLDALRRESEDYDIPAPAESRRQLEAEGEDYEDTGETTLENSFVNLDAYGAGVSYVGGWGFVGLSVKRTETDYGVPGHAHEHEHEEGEDEDHDEDHEEEEEVVTIGLEQTRYDLSGAYEFVAGPLSQVRFAGGYADYTHTEFEGEETGTVFTSEGYEGRVEFVQRRRGGWDGAFGVQALSRDFNAIGDEAYVPQTDITEFGAYTLQRLDRGTWGLEGGLRVDTRDLDSVAASESFTNVSGSVGVFAKPADGWFVGLSVSRNGRAPTEAELFAEGPHIATRAFEIGDPTLDNEEVTSLEAALHYEDEGLFEADLHLFHATYDGFIDLRPTGAEEDELPVFQYVQTDAEFYGAEAEARVTAWEGANGSLALTGGFDIVRGSTDLGAPARIPPFSLTAGVEGEFGPLVARFKARRVGSQDRVAEFELPTDAYTRYDAFLGWRPAALPGAMVFVEGQNLSDEEIREHASFLKDLAPSPGRNVRVGVSYAF